MGENVINRTLKHYIFLGSVDLTSGTLQRVAPKYKKTHWKATILELEEVILYI